MQLFNYIDSGHREALTVGDEPNVACLIVQFLIPKLIETSNSLELVNLSVVYQCEDLRLTVEGVFIDLHARVCSSELVTLRIDKRIDL